MTLESVILVVHVLLALSLLGLILIQHGKGADAGAAFGSGASGTVFGAAGSASFLTKVTTWLAIAFFATSLGLEYLSAHSKKDANSVFDRVVEEQSVAPAAVTSEDLPVSEPIAEDIPAVEAPAASDIPAAE